MGSNALSIKLVRWLFVLAAFSVFVSHSNRACTVVIAMVSTNNTSVEYLSRTLNGNAPNSGFYSFVILLQTFERFASQWHGNRTSAVIFLFFFPFFFLSRVFHSKFRLVWTWFSSSRSLSVLICPPKQDLHRVPVVCLPLSGLHLLVPHGGHFDWYSINRQTQTPDRGAFVLASSASSFTINSLRCVDARNAESDPSPSRVAAHWPGIRLRASSETSFPPHLCSEAALSLSGLSFTSRGGLIAW